MTNINFDASPVFSPLILQLLKTEAMIFAYAKTTFDEEQFAAFSKEIGKQFKISVKEFREDFPNLFEGSNEVLDKALRESVSSK